MAAENENFEEDLHFVIQPYQFEPEAISHRRNRRHQPIYSSDETSSSSEDDDSNGSIQSSNVDNWYIFSRFI